MIKGIESILLSSPNDKKLAAFYKDKVGLKQTLEAEMGDRGEKLFGFELKAGSGFYIMDHSEVKGANKQPQRYLLNFEVEEINTEVKKLLKKGVKQIQDVYHVEDYGLIATFADVDGNYFQLVQVQVAKSSN